MLSAQIATMGNQINDLNTSLIAAKESSANTRV
jgi:hypothetical protein